MKKPFSEVKGAGATQSTHESSFHWVTVIVWQWPMSNISIKIYLPRRREKSNNVIHSDHVISHVLALIQLFANSVVHNASGIGRIAVQYKSCLRVSIGNLRKRRKRWWNCEHSKQWRDVRDSRAKKGDDHSKFTARVISLSSVSMQIFPQLVSLV